MNKTIPIKNQMNGVFVHVSNLRVSVKWYADRWIVKQKVMIMVTGI